MVELKVVYRFLRKVSDWAIDGFYDDVQVFGPSSADPNPTPVIPHKGPVILACSHHNEIIDIATLAETVGWYYRPAASTETNPHRQRNLRTKGRHVHFWAKESMFRNPIIGGPLRSSGAIPVRRGVTGSANGTNPSSAANTSQSGSHSNSSLFTSTSRTLSALSNRRDEGQVVGIFPEGTSYTQPRIIQVLSGVSWAAVEYTKWWQSFVNTRKGGRYAGPRGKAVPELVIIPVAIVYTNKAKYLSRVRVEYGTPISMDEYASELFSSVNTQGLAQSEREREVVKLITNRITSALEDMTINAPDWPTLYAATTARQILWGDDEKVPLSRWVFTSQSLVDMFAPSPAASADVEPEIARENVKQTLLEYYALLYHTGLEHSILESLASSSTTSTPENLIRHPSVSSLVTPSLSIYTIPIALRELTQFILFIPPLAVYLPSFVTSRVLYALLGTPGEEEGISQFKAVGSGAGIGIGLAVGWNVTKKHIAPAFLRRLTALLVTSDPAALIGTNTDLAKNLAAAALLEVLSNPWVQSLTAGISTTALSWFSPPWVSSTVGWISSVLSLPISKTITSLVGRTLGFYAFAYVMVKWYGLFAKVNYTRYKTLRTRIILILSLLRGSKSRLSTDLLEEEQKLYITLPPPPTNEFIRRRVAKADPLATDDGPLEASTSQGRRPRSLKPRPSFIPPTHILHLLYQKRDQAAKELAVYLDHWVAAKPAERGPKMQLIRPSLQP